MSQRLRCFPTESRAAIFPQRRQDCPLPLPINRVGFDDLRGEKFGSKVSQKTSIFTQFLQIFLLLLSSSATGNRHRLPPTPPLQPPAEPPHHSSHNPFGQANSQRKKKQGAAEEKKKNSHCNATACRHPAPPCAIAGDSSHDHSFQVPLLSLFSVPSSLLSSSACRT